MDRSKKSLLWLALAVVVSLVVVGGYIAALRNSGESTCSILAKRSLDSESTSNVSDDQLDQHPALREALTGAAGGSAGRVDISCEMRDALISDLETAGVSEIRPGPVYSLRYQADVFEVRISRDVSN